MSFHFQPQADSSDEDGQVDLATWQSGVSSQRKSLPIPAPVASIRQSAVAQVDEDQEERNDFNAVEGDKEEAEEEHIDGQSEDEGVQTPAKTSFRQHKQTAGPLVLSGFTSVNQPPARSEASAPRAEHDQSDDSSGIQVLNATARRCGMPRSMLVPVLPLRHVEDDDDDLVLDFTRGRHVVRRVKREITTRQRDVLYRVEFEDRHIEEVPFEELLEYENAQSALDVFESQPTPESNLEPLPTRSKMPTTRSGRKSTRPAGFVSTVDAVELSDNEASSGEDFENARISRYGRKRKQLQTAYEDELDEDDDEAIDILEESDDGPSARRRSRRAASSRRSLRSARHPLYADDLQDDDDDLPFLDSDLPGAKRRRLSLRNSGTTGHSKRFRPERIGERQSGRSTRHQGGMEEVGENEIYRSDSSEGTKAPAKPQKAVGAREVFQILPRNDEFRMRHVQDCETCGQGANFAPLIYCQGCTLAYHKSCLGPRANREHLATKMSDGNSVLQCRRCVGFAKKKDPTAPDQGKCADCREHGAACRPFRPRKTTIQEQKERDDNDGEDTSYDVDPSRVNQADNVLFRCLTCWRAFHFAHLPSRSDMMDLDSEVDTEQRFREYSRDWKCKECLDMPSKVSGLVAWKPLDEDSYDPALAFEQINEDEKAYLVKWDGMSYFRACWMPGAWVWGVSAPAMRRAFAKKEESSHPKMRTEDAIPEDYLRTDIVLDIKFTSIVDICTEEIDKARIREVDKALIKYRGLGYEDAVWEAPPSPEDGERWTDFVLAYNDWVLGRYVRVPKTSTIKSRLDKARHLDFAKLEKKTQPENVNGGELMKFQIEGLNWLYYKWFTLNNAILADEMGLGKTIQIIAFLATLVADRNCFPFLVVVPNSTCPNWRREIKRWAPTLRVVAYYGSREGRELAYKYELFPGGGKELRCHVVVTSYDAAADDKALRFFKSVHWQGLIVDEGQRLKNDKTLLYSALEELKAPFRILLTGTPLQNNARELFNLIHFLDPSKNAAALEEEFQDLNKDKITQLHEMIRPFFLRRTKAQVLTFLPPMAQIIVPVSMTIVQKKLYRSILAKNPELMKAIFSSEGTVKQNERGALSNILMQLRKCLCHPFVYSQGIEDRNVTYTASHRNLVDAGSKLKLLEIMLPKLKERGHRVLIFSQFLNMLDIAEDFLDGMQLRYHRLDGSISALQKQKRIDEFNAPDSQHFAFLLSTRAGGVGINLATADTVIILDPDFNPHQDIQALSRAHRIGQVKKVLCFQLVTRASAEERIMQTGRRKLALDHVLIQEMDANDADEADLVSILRHGAREIFEDSGETDIAYDGPSVDRLLDRSHIEDTKTGGDKSAETQFSFARVWANDSAVLEEETVEAVEEEQQAPDLGVWANILRERERVAAEEAAAKADAYGRGRRARGAVDYARDAPEGVEGLDITPLKSKKTRNADESDTDFEADGSEPDDDAEDGEDESPIAGDELDGVENGAKRDIGTKKVAPSAPPPFKRANVPQTRYVLQGMSTPIDVSVTGPNGNCVVISEGVHCAACRTFHAQGRCPLKLAGVEYCNLCGMAHYGSARVCPHIQSETQVRHMIDALKNSNEPEHLIAEARRYLRGLKGNLVQMKKQKEAKSHAMQEAQIREQYRRARGPVWGDGGGI